MPIVLYARLLQSSIAYWQALAVFQKQMLLSLSSSAMAEPDLATHGATHGAAHGAAPRATAGVPPTGNSTGNSTADSQGNLATMANGPAPHERRLVGA